MASFVICKKKTYWQSCWSSYGDYKYYKTADKPQSCGIHQPLSPYMKQATGGATCVASPFSAPLCLSLHCKGGIVTIEGWQIANFPSTLLLYHKLGNKTVVVLTLFQCACWVNLLPLYPACLLHFSGDTKHGYICVWMWSNWGQTDYRTWWQQCFPDSKHTWINEPQLMIAIIRFDFLSLPFCMKCGWG